MVMWWLDLKIGNYKMYWVVHRIKLADGLKEKNPKVVGRAGED